ncbi:hypothetical protein PG995_016421 [Apiospora arundinis]
MTNPCHLALSLSLVVSTFDVESDVPRPSAAACDASSSTYTVKKGDTCYEIAQAHGLTPTDILHANPQMNNDCDLINIGQVICLPGGGAVPPTGSSAGATPTDSSSTQETPSTAASSQPPTPTTTTNPEEGDNSSSGNDSPSSSSSSTSTSTSTSKTGCALRHTVIPGDTCHDMWTKYSLTQDEFLSLNPRLSMRPDGYCGIAVGDVVCVSGSSGRDSGSGNGGGGASPPPSPSNPFTGSLSVLSVIPVTETDKKAVERASPAPATEESRRLLRWLPVTFQTSTVRETADE